MHKSVVFKTSVQRSYSFNHLRLCWRRLSRSSVPQANQPNVPLDLDPSLRALLRDVDISLTEHRSGTHSQRSNARVLEIFPLDDSNAVTESVADEERFEDTLNKKSPAALFGSQKIGAVVLPAELRTSINLVISESDKARLHHDAKRLFYDKDADASSESGWEALYDRSYRSRHQAQLHSERDSTAFISVALPAHYSAIRSVLNHVKHRLEPEWTIHRVIDWGAATGSGFWASAYTFQSDTSGMDEELRVANSTLKSYLGIDKREGLVTMGKRLLRNLDPGQLNLNWQKSFKNEDKIRRSLGHDVLALSAFMLSSLQTPLARKTLVKEMWESGAHVIVLIDHNSTTGFECIAEARQFLLNVGGKEFDNPAAEDWDIKGCHVIAPCPHDQACPLYYPGSSHLACRFSQRLQRPEFVRRTKHSGLGHENMEYSYVAIRRGPRPIAVDMKVGRIGEVGKRDLDKKAASAAPIKELMLHSEHEDPHAASTSHEAFVEDSVQQMASMESLSRSELDEALKLEAYQWPRLVFPPLKRSGHIILDSCTAEGKLMRLIIPKSQGKQPFYDARKSAWGDLFPHEPKNPPQERLQPQRAKRNGSGPPIKGADIGKRGKTEKKERLSYEALSEELKETKKKSRRDKL